MGKRTTKKISICELVSLVERLEIPINRDWRKNSGTGAKPAVGERLEIQAIPLGISSSLGENPRNVRGRGTRPRKLRLVHNIEKKVRGQPLGAEKGVLLLWAKKRKKSQQSKGERGYARGLS